MNIKLNKRYATSIAGGVQVKIMLMSKGVKYWPVHLYHETLEKAHILVVGAGLTHLEPYGFALSGTRMTIIDTSKENLDLALRYLNILEVDPNRVHLRHYRVSIRVAAFTTFKSFLFRPKPLAIAMLM